jgi:amino-acid N-acetyltransferase
MIRTATARDWSAIERLLTDSGLPLDGARDHIDRFIVAEENGAIAGCAALERYGEIALLRSVAVDSPVRGRRLGERLVSQLIAIARRDGIESLFLLTTTAAEWFPRFGFRSIERGLAPAGLSKSSEFRGACPATAVLMSLDLGGR